VDWGDGTGERCRGHRGRPDVPKLRHVYSERSDLVGGPYRHGAVLWPRCRCRCWAGRLPPAVVSGLLGQKPCRQEGGRRGLSGVEALCRVMAFDWGQPYNRQRHGAVAGSANPMAETGLLPKPVDGKQPLA